MSIRVALGASRGRLVRKVMVESLLLAVAGGVLGIGVAYAGTMLMLRLAFQNGGPNNYIPIDAAPSWPILLFTLVVSVLTGAFQRHGGLLRQLIIGGRVQLVVVVGARCLGDIRNGVLVQYGNARSIQATLRDDVAGERLPCRVVDDRRDRVAVLVAAL